VPNVLVVHPSAGFDSVAQLIQRARERPGSLSFGSAASAAPTIWPASSSRSAQVQMMHVPYEARHRRSTICWVGRSR
jgi:tripartite-type tricarboxylate transporter receptor subunit TctC